MSLTGLFQNLESSQEFLELVGRLESARGVRKASVLEAAKPFLLASLYEKLDGPMLVVGSRPDDARRLHGDLLTYLGESAPVHLFPEIEVLPFERLVADSATNNQRLLTLESLAGWQSDDPPFLIVASVASLVRKTMSPQVFHDARHSLAVGQRIRLRE